MCFVACVQPKSRRVSIRRTFWSVPACARRLTRDVAGELVFGVAHIFASFNDTFVHVTDLSGKETIVRVTGKLSFEAALESLLQQSDFVCNGTQAV